MNALHLVAYIKQTLKINESTSLYIESGGTVVGMTSTMAELCEKFTENDGFVYLRIKTEDSF